jgi:hypothetical protein
LGDSGFFYFWTVATNSMEIFNKPSYCQLLMS